jgi:TolB protein
VKILVFIILAVLVSSPSFAEQSYLEVTAQGNKQVGLAIAPSIGLSGADSNIAETIGEVLKFDLTLAGPFNVLPAAPQAAPEGIRPEEVDFNRWRATGALLLIKSGYTVNGGTVTLEFRLYDVLKGKSLSAKRYTAKRSDIRKMTHSFSDETMLAVTGERGPFTSKITFTSNATGNKNIYLMDYDGYNVQRLTGNNSINLNPAFSPDGREIVYTSYKNGNPDLYRREIFTGAEAKISSRPGINVTGAWSPDGGRVALTMSKDGNSEIYVIAKSGKLLGRLTHNGSIDISPTWSPDGSRIAFVSDRLGSPQIFVMNSDGSNQRRLTTSGSYNVNPSWSPKGDRILYCRQQGGGFQVYAINPDGSNDTQLTTSGRNEYARWSPDGRFITFGAGGSRRSAIYVMRADGSGQTRVSRGKASDSQPYWSPRW